MLSPQIEAARLAWSGAKLWIKAVIVLALLLALAFAIYRGVDAIYEAGKTAQREADQAAEYAAAQLAASQASAARGASYAVTDETRAAAAAIGAKATTETAETRKAINDDFKANPELANPCTPDGRPAAVPDSVRKKLDQARKAAESGAAAHRL